MPVYSISSHTLRSWTDGEDEYKLKVSFLPMFYSGEQTNSIRRLVNLEENGDSRQI